MVNPWAWVSRAGMPAKSPFASCGRGMLDQVWLHELVVSWRMHYTEVFTWLMLRPILLLTGWATVGNLQRRKGEIGG
jgi:hypothetical protein